jgi:23S rRNA pseudouridine2605 synthase
MKKRNEFLKDPKFTRTSAPKREGQDETRYTSARPARDFGKGDRVVGPGFKSRKKPTEKLFNKPTLKKADLDRLKAEAAASRSVDRPARSFDGPGNDDRAPRRDFDRPRSDDRPRDDRPARSFDRDRRDDRAPRRDFDRPRRDDRPRDDRPARSFDRDRRDDRAPRRDFDRPRNDDRPRDDRPARSFDRDRKDDRAPRRDFDRPRSDDRPRDDRPARSFDRPRSDDRYAGKAKRNDSPTNRQGDDRNQKNDQTPSEGESRRVGRFSRPPRYDFSDYENRKPQVKKQTDDDVLRLNRYIANAGICSRREADELIEAGQITVNGAVVTEMGYKVKRSDVVKYGKKLLNPERMVYLLINKPKDYITTTEDPEDRRTVMDLVAGACEERIYPVGRLDRNTTGLLLLTNDGELAKKLTHPSSNIKKIYQAELDKPITTEDFEALQAGVELEDGFVKPDDLGIVTPDAMVVGLEIHSGKNRIVRRMFEHIGYEVQKLDRTVFAGLNKKDLPRGKWRFLSEKEVVKLKFML